MPGQPWSSAIGDLIRRVQVVAFLVSGELRSFAEQELALAQQAGKAVVPILVASASQPPEPLGGMGLMQLRPPGDAGPVADLLAARAKDLFYDDEARPENLKVRTVVVSFPQGLEDLNFCF